MPETGAVDGPPVARAAETVSASALALHLDCSRTYIGKLEAEVAVTGSPERPLCADSD